MLLSCFYYCFKFMFKLILLCAMWLWIFNISLCLKNHISVVGINSNGVKGLTVTGPTYFMYNYATNPCESSLRKTFFHFSSLFHSILYEVIVAFTEVSHEWGWNVENNSKADWPVPQKVWLSGCSYENKKGLLAQQLPYLDTQLWSLLSGFQMCIFVDRYVQNKSDFTFCYSPYLCC